MLLQTAATDLLLLIWQIDCFDQGATSWPAKLATPESVEDGPAPNPSQTSPSSEYWRHVAIREP